MAIMSNEPMTHWETCWMDVRHGACACRRVRELEAEVAALRGAGKPMDWEDILNSWREEVNILEAEIVTLKRALNAIVDVADEGNYEEVSEPKMEEIAREATGRPDPHPFVDTSMSCTKAFLRMPDGSVEER